MNLFVPGVGASLTQRLAALGSPAPNTLGGISVQLSETAPFNSANQSIQQQGPVPILGVAPMSTCNFAPVQLFGKCQTLAIITVQIPFWLEPDPVSPFRQIAELRISENGVPVTGVLVKPVNDAIHIITFCDVQFPPSSVGGPYCFTPGDPLVTHADGSLVNAGSHPAHSGDVLVLWAFGLGVTNPAVQEGQASPLPPATVGSGNIGIAFDFSGDAGPKAPHSITNTSELLFAGLTPGFMGLYQVNFVVPKPPPGTPPCPSPQAVTNMTVSLVGLQSSDSAKICVDPMSGL